MSDINELEERLKSDRRMLDRILADMNSIQCEIDEIKRVSRLQQATEANLDPTIPVYQGASQPQTAYQDNSASQNQFTSQNNYIQNNHTQNIYNQQSSSIYQKNPQSYQTASQPVQSFQPHQPVQNNQPVQPHNSVQQKPQGYKQPRQKTDTEALLGKNIMGIAASILIFISFILFATLIIPKLTEEIKITLMLGVSFGITALGLFKWFKKKESIFFLSLSACGIGSIYISLFLCNIYFHIINDIVLYFLLLAWAAGVLFLSRYKQYIFEIIGCLGILVSVFFGGYSCGKSSDEMMLMILCIYTIVGFIAYLLFSHKDNIAYMLCSACSIVGIGYLLITAYDIKNTVISSNGDTVPGTEICIASILTICYLAFMIFINLKQTNENNFDYYPIFGALNYSLIIPAIYVMKIGGSEYKSYSGFIILILNFLMYAILEYLVKTSAKFIRKGVGIHIWQILMFSASTYICLDLKQINSTTSVFPLAMVLILYGFLMDSNLSRILGIISYGILIFCFSLDVVPLMSFGILLFATINICMYFKRNTYNTGYKFFSLIIFILGIVISIVYFSDNNDLNDETAIFLTILIPGIINFFGTKTPYANNWLTREREKSIQILGYIINAILMIGVLCFIVSVENDTLHFLSVLVAIALFMINTFNLMKTENSGAKIYIGAKFTVLLLIILSSYDSPQYVISIATFVLAIIFIVIGFVMNIKSLRLYGLIVSMICVIKLVMVDITYQNTAGHALSFFISGVLCFAISALYSFADKKLKKTTAPITPVDSSTGTQINNATNKQFNNLADKQLDLNIPPDEPTWSYPGNQHQR